MKKLIIVLFAVLFSLTFVACDDPQEEPCTSHVDANSDGKCDNCGATVSTECTNHADADGDGKCDNCGIDVDVNEDVVTTLQDWVSDGDYTLNEYMSGTTDMCWNPLTWETTNDSYVLGYITMGFYDYVFNADKTSYRIVCEMAASLPVDVTSNYVGRYGVSEGESLKAWRIELNRNAKWETGEAITTEDYIYSMQQQLDPEQLNRRADSYYGDFSIYNAKNYLYGQSEYVYVSLVEEGYTSVADATSKAGHVYLDLYGFWNMKGGFDEQGNACPQYVDITSTTLYYDPSFDKEDELDEYGNPVHDVDNDEAWISAADIYRRYREQLEVGGSADENLYVQATNENYGIQWEQVGLFAIDDYNLVIVLDEPIENPEFYLPYQLSSTWLVNETLYESCWKTQPGQNTQVNDYCTSKDTTISYGPYKLSYFEADKQISFERNENWYGWTDGKHKGQYTTDKVSCQIIAKQETALLNFLQGKLDDVSLVADNMDRYNSSDYILYTPESYTTKVTINTDYNSLVKRESNGVNKRILTVNEFRQAISYAIDREYFAQAFSSASNAGYGLLNYIYKVFDDEDLTESYSYRDYDAAKEALLKLYGMTYGPGQTYETLNEAYRAITGYDMTKAKQLMQDAYDIASSTLSIEDSRALYVNGETITIRLSVYSNDALYQKMYVYLRDQIYAAAKGTPFENKIRLEMQVDADYYNSLYQGKTDMVFSTWGGASYNTFSMLGSVYCDDHTGNGNQMEIGFNTNEVDVKLNINERDYTFSLKEWADWLYQGNDKVEASLGKPAAYSYTERVAIFSELEYQFLSSFTAIPLYYRQSASLHSQKVNYGTENYLELVGYGGIRYITYNYTDQEWEDYCANTTLDYE